MKVSSFYDTNGQLYVDCTECERGKNGNDDDKCSCGVRVKFKNRNGCFCGTLIPKYADQLRTNIEKQKKGDLL